MVFVNRYQGVLLMLWAIWMSYYFYCFWLSQELEMVQNQAFILQKNFYLHESQMNDFMCQQCQQHDVIEVNIKPKEIGWVAGVIRYSAGAA